MTTQFNQMQIIKRRFFAMRNGLLADQMRRAGSNFRIIFGLNIIQLSDIAAEYGHNIELAEALWDNVTTRESMLLAPMLWDASDFDRGAMLALCHGITDREVADMVCHRLLKRRDDAVDIVADLYASGVPLLRYTALRLALALTGSRLSPQQALALAQTEITKADPSTLGLATMLKSEAEFLMEE